MKESLALHYVKYLRVCLILLVLLQHTIISYSTYAHYDYSNYIYSVAPIVSHVQSKWVNVVVDFDDTFMMPTLFFLSGLFFFSSLSGGSFIFLKKRFIRLMIPFFISVIFIVPIVEYFPYQATGHSLDYFNFWRYVYFANHWYSGPPWFLWVLFSFNIIMLVIYKLIPHLMTSVGKFITQSTHHIALILFLPCIIYIFSYCCFPSQAPDSWVSLWGPFWVQKNRYMWYFSYFMIGALVGFYPQTLSSFLGAANPLFKRPVWLGLTLSSLFFLEMASFFHLSIIYYALAFSLTTYCMLLTLLAYFSHLFQQKNFFFEYLSSLSYAIYIVHWPIVVGLQYICLMYGYTALLMILLIYFSTIVISISVSKFLHRFSLVQQVL